jgi:hypothetical protein
MIEFHEDTMLRLKFSYIHIRGGKIPAIPNPLNLSIRPPAREAVNGRINIYIFIFYLGFGRVSGFMLLVGWIPDPLKHLIINIKKYIYKVLNYP